MFVQIHFFSLADSFFFAFPPTALRSLVQGYEMTGLVIRAGSLLIVVVVVVFLTVNQAV